ncbi:hypothetical protein [Aquisalibacillus elongatus]|uniref:Uncharacterized protein n=1 Tax=Aquisalibacillus elongatus TaxID=485577 RepID=A0A3N5AXU7_9BACI|nr:hypothetical protein [Aquisalibacillus elongatus]RPF50076.1 hypothetical protein EDC24_2893 [Aquisalibacillus elongatus]
MMLLSRFSRKVNNGFEVVKRRLNNEKGAELMEWIGMTLVVIAILGAVIAFFSDGGGTEIGQSIMDFINKQIENLTNSGE